MVSGNKQILNHLQFEGPFWNLEEVRDPERIVISSYLARETTQLGLEHTVLRTYLRGTSARSTSNVIYS